MLGRQLANSARTFVHNKLVQGVTSTPPPLTALVAGFGSLCMLLELLGEAFTKSFPVLTRFVTTANLVLSQILGSVVLNDTSFLQLETLTTGMVNEEMSQMRTELQSMPKEMADWMVSRPAALVHVADRLLAGIVANLHDNHDPIEDVALLEVVNSFASIRGLATEGLLQYGARVHFAPVIMPSGGSCEEDLWFVDV